MNQNGLSLETAQQLILQAAKALPGETSLLANALGKVLAEDIYAPLNVPNFRRSPFDGFALRASDLRGATPATPVEIKIIDQVPAGDTRHLNTLPQQTGVKIMTGAPVPSGADVVVKKEDVLLSNNHLLLTSQIPSNTNILPVGTDITQGDLVFTTGDAISPYHIGALAGLGMTAVKTYALPKVAVISTGSELKNPGETLEFGQIYSSNQATLLALIKSVGGIGFGLGIIPDQVAAIKQGLTTALASHDLVITTGGTSVGDYDFTEKILRDLGAEILFNQINLRPGSSTIAAKYQDKLVFGLSGNPSGAAISFELLIRPLIKKLRGEKGFLHPLVTAILPAGYKKSGAFRRMIPVHLSYESNGWTAVPVGKPPFGVLTSLVNCNALADIPAGSGPLPPGATVSVLMLS